MQCSRCGADVPPGMAECPQCGAPVDASAGAGYAVYRPPERGAGRYVPGGGQAPQQPMSFNQPEQPQGQQRPLGSLQRRLQRSQASAPGDDSDDDWDDVPPARPDRGRGAQGQSANGRRASSGTEYGDRSRRSQPASDARGRRPSQGGARSRGDDRRYDDYDESREEPAYSPYPPYRPDEDSREQPAWDESREQPSQRGRNSRDRYRPMEESAEMSVERPAYDAPRRSTPRRGSRPPERRYDDTNDFTNPLDDPRSPLRGSQGRRPSQGSGSRGGRSSSGRSRGGESYTEAEMRSQGYRDDTYEQASYRGGYDGYSEEAPAARGGARGRAAYDTSYDDDYASRERWAAPYGETDYGPARGDTNFGASAEMWQPAAARSRGASVQARPRRGGTAKPAPKAKGSPVKLIVGLLATLALIAVMGIEFGPRVYQKYVAHSGGSAQQQFSGSCATVATPTAANKPPQGYSAFATTAYSMAYPSNWQSNSQSGAAASQCDVVYLFSQPNGAAKFNVEEAGSFAPITDLQIIQAEAQSAQQQGSTFTEITSAATTQTIGGEVWQRHEYQVTTKTNIKLHLALLATHHKGAGFAIVLLSSDAGFASDDTTTFEPILHTFQFV